MESYWKNYRKIRGNSRNQNFFGNFLVKIASFWKNMKVLVGIKLNFFICLQISQILSDFQTFFFSRKLMKIVIWLNIGCAIAHPAHPLPPPLLIIGKCMQRHLHFPWPNFTAMNIGKTVRIYWQPYDTILSQYCSLQFWLHTEI